MSKEIWVPKSETSATVEDGYVRVWTSMQFYCRHVEAAPPPPLPPDLRTGGPGDGRPPRPKLS